MHGAESIRGDLRAQHPWRLVKPAHRGGSAVGCSGSAGTTGRIRSGSTRSPCHPTSSCSRCRLAGYLGFSGVRRGVLRDVHLRPALAVAWIVAAGGTIIKRFMGTAMALEREVQAELRLGGRGAGRGARRRRHSPCSARRLQEDALLDTPPATRSATAPACLRNPHGERQRAASL